MEKENLRTELFSLLHEAWPGFILMKRIGKVILRGESSRSQTQEERSVPEEDDD